ncbi:murein hydrolase activator EnvC family protein [Streptomyces sp. NPDC091377]|uniref:murein hydrolase activator EnvC family protein n=1 Tax=Streptomyces sp. NPDC091377 TaxID=3365995 RepID=UPI0037F2308F
MSARKLAVTVLRLSIPAVVLLIALDLTVGVPGTWVVVISPSIVGFLAVVLVHRFTRAADRGPVEIAAPVTGRWSALNSPADRTPSHGTHAYGQTYAIDIVAEPADQEGGAGSPGARPGFRWLWPVVRRNADFPAFGAPILAVADATVVRTGDGQRDHLSRGSLPALVYLMIVEALVRELMGVRRILGNHVVLDLGDGTYALYGHLQKGSLTVREGDRVRTGQVIARCGNSGNTTEPHLHFQLMDGPDPVADRGVPFTWRGLGVPRNKETFEAPEAPEAPETPAGEGSEALAGGAPKTFPGEAPGALRGEAP